MRKWIFIALLVLMLATTPTLAITELPDPRVRVAHYAIDVPVVDVYIDGERALQELALTQFTDYLDFAAGTYSISIVPAGERASQAIAGPLDITLAAGAQYTLLATGLLENDSFTVLFINETQAIADAGIPDGAYASFYINGYSFADTVRITLDGTPIVSNLAYGDFAVRAHQPGGVILGARTANGQVISETPIAQFPAREFRIVMSDGEQSAILPITGEIEADNLEFLRFLNDISFNDVGTFNTLLQAIDVAGLESELADLDAYRFYAPTDDAFAALPDGQLDELLANPEALRDVLAYHILTGEPVTAVPDEPLTFTTLQGDDVTILVSDAGFVINDSAQVVTGFLTANGLINVIDGVLIPPTQD